MAELTFTPTGRRLIGILRLGVNGNMLTPFYLPEMQFAEVGRTEYSCREKSPV